MYHHRELLLIYIRSLLPGELSATIDAVDILQDVYIELMATESQWVTDSGDTLLRGMKTIARHNVIDLLRRHRALKRGGGNVVSATDLFRNSAEHLIEQLAKHEKTPSKSAMSHEVSALVRQTLDQLPADQANAIRLRYLSGLTLAEVGTKMSRTQEAAEQLCRRALKELRQKLYSSLPRR